MLRYTLLFAAEMTIIAVFFILGQVLHWQTFTVLCFYTPVFHTLAYPALYVAFLAHDLEKKLFKNIPAYFLSLIPIAVSIFLSRNNPVISFWSILLNAPRTLILLFGLILLLFHVIENRFLKNANNTASQLVLPKTHRPSIK